MSFIQNLFSSRDNNANGVTYVGQSGRIWWNPDTNAFYSSDGNTAGGVPISVANTANVTLNTATITGNLVVLGNISPAGNNKIGGIFPGPGVVIGNTGQLTINSANLPVSFGNFTASNNVLSIVNVDENMILTTSGNAEVQLVGNVGFYKPDGLPPNTANRYAEFNKDGQVTFYIPTSDVTGAVQIIGSTSGNSIPPGQTGAHLLFPFFPFFNLQTYGCARRIFPSGSGPLLSDFQHRRYRRADVLPRNLWDPQHDPGRRF